MPVVQAVIDTLQCAMIAYLCAYVYASRSRLL